MKFSECRQSEIDSNYYVIDINIKFLVDYHIGNYNSDIIFVNDEKYCHKFFVHDIHVLPLVKNIK